MLPDPYSPERETGSQPDSVPRFLVMTEQWQQEKEAERRAFAEARQALVRLGVLHPLPKEKAERPEQHRTEKGEP